MNYKGFVPYKESLVLKELGFDEECFGFYSPIYDLMICNTSGLNEDVGECLAPLYQQALTWFDDNTEYQGFVIGSIKENYFDWEIREDGNIIKECNQCYTSRNDASLDCIRALIKLQKK